MMSSSITRSFGAWALAGLLVTAAAAQEPPFEGIVTADRVNVRSGAGDTHYVVTTLNSGDRVRVLKNIYGWYEIAPPTGAFSYIAREDVKLDPSGMTGVVAGDRANVRAPSPAGADTGASFKIQLRLARGARVQVLGEAGEFYKIVPPPGATLFVHREFVRPATAADAPRPAAPAAEPPAATQPGSATEPRPATPPPVPPAITPPAAAEPATAPAPASAPVAPVTVHVGEDGGIVIDGEPYTVEEFSDYIDEALVDQPDLRVVVQGHPRAEREAVAEVLDRAREAGVREVAVAALEPAAPAAAPDGAAPTEPAEAPAPRFEDVERRYSDARTLPLIEQPLTELIMAYEELLAGGRLSSTDRGLAEARIRVLRYRREIQSRLADVQALRQQLDLTRQQREEEARRRPKTYTVVGRLQASTLYTGEKVPLLYRIVDPASSLTLAYVQPPGDDDYAAIVGQFVGVVGDKEYDPALKLQIVKASEVDVLRAEQ